MKVHGKKKENFLIEVTPYEMEVITTALFEWQHVEDYCDTPDRRFSKVLNRVHKQVGRFEKLPLIKGGDKLLD